MEQDPPPPVPALDNCGCEHVSHALLSPPDTCPASDPASLLMGKGPLANGTWTWWPERRSIHISASLLIKASLYLRAPPNFVHLPVVVPPSSKFPSALLLEVLHFFSFDNNFFLLKLCFPPPSPKMSFLCTENFMLIPIRGSYVPTSPLCFFSWMLSFYYQSFSSSFFNIFLAR